MITLTTGTPGAGKTLYTICYVEAMRKKTGREVFVSGITDLTLPWTPIEGYVCNDKDRTVLKGPEDWWRLPPGSIVVLDEAQRAFRPRGSGGAVPEHVAQLETHRHHGFDLFIITQHPMLIDSNIRRLVGQHFHAIRRWGGHRAVINEWSSCKEISKASVLEAVRHDFRYPKEAFGWYKSAEVHTHKRRIPMRVWFLWASPVLVAGLLYLGYQSLNRMHSKPLTKEAEGVEQMKSVPMATTTASSNKGPLTAEEYRMAHVPRVQGLPHTAPHYDGVTQPVRAPAPVACVASARACSCASQDGTRMHMGEELCRSIVAGGLFLDFDVIPVQARMVEERATHEPVKGAVGAPGSAGGSGTAVDPLLRVADRTRPFVPTSVGTADAPSTAGARMFGSAKSK